MFFVFFVFSISVSAEKIFVATVKQTEKQELEKQRWLEEKTFEKRLEKENTESEVVVDTPTVINKIVRKKFTRPFVTSSTDYFQLSVGIRLRSFNGLSNVIPTGFTNEAGDETESEVEAVVQYKFGRFAIEYIPLDHTRTLDTEFYGSSLGGIKVITNNVIILKCFGVDNSRFGLSIGAGIESTQIEGAVSMGGFEFTTTGKGWSPIVQIGALYHMSKDFSLGLDYEKTNLQIRTEIPGVPDLVSSFTERFAAKVLVRVF